MKTIFFDITVEYCHAKLPCSPITDNTDLQTYMAYVGINQHDITQENSDTDIPSLSREVKSPMFFLCFTGVIID